MPRFKVVATAVLALALALLLASCSDSTDSAGPSKVAARQQKLERAHEDGIEAHRSMDKWLFVMKRGACAAEVT
jgi:outer membrane biogenesis lipoprotein LolB